MNYTKATDARVELYRDTRVQVLVGVLIDRRLNELAPRLDGGRIPRFPIVENILGESPSEIVHLLESMSRAGLMRKKIYQKLLCCPVCHSAGQVFTRYLCARCKSARLKFQKAVRHLQCRNIFYLEEGQNHSEMVCPYCKYPLIGDGDYTMAGTEVTCADCGSTNLEVLQAYFCPDCESDFTFSRAYIREVYSYVLNRRLLKEMRSNLILLKIKNKLVAQGYAVQMPGYITDVSGVQHSFAIVATFDKEVLTVDLMLADRTIDASQILPIYIKLARVKPAKSLVIVSPDLTDDAKTLCESSSLSWISHGLEDLLKTSLEKMLQSVEIKSGAGKSAAR